jgi:hypothetical protein
MEFEEVGFLWRSYFSISAFAFRHSINTTAQPPSPVLPAAALANFQGSSLEGVPQSLDRLAHVLDDSLGIAKHHHGFVHVEQF